MPRAKYKLASHRLTPGGYPKVSSPIFNLIHGERLTTPTINPQVAKIQYTPLPNPPITINTAFNSAVKFTDVVVDAAFRYKQRENEAFANQALLDFQSRLRVLYEGETNTSGRITEGYVNTRGLTAVSEHPRINQSINAEYESILSGLEPAVQQKAALRMSASRDTYLSLAAKHRSQQFKLAEKDHLYQKRKETIIDLSHNPSGIYNINPVTGLTGKETFYKNCIDPKACDSEWTSLIYEVGEKIYLDAMANKSILDLAEREEIAVDKASKFYNTIGSVELASSPAFTTRAQANLLSWENSAITAYNSKIENRRKKDKKDLENRYDQNERKLEARRLNGEYLNKSELADLIIADLIDPRYARVYENEVFGSANKIPELGAIEAWNKILINLASTDYVDVEGKYGKIGKNWKYELERDNSLDTASRTMLKKLRKDLRSPGFNNNYKRGTEQLDAWLKGPTWAAGIFTRDEQQLINQARNELHTRLSRGEGATVAGFNSLMIDLRKEYGLRALRPLKSGRRPGTRDQIAEEIKNVQRLGEISPKLGGYSEEEIEVELRKLSEYVELINLQPGEE